MAPEREKTLKNQWFLMILPSLAFPLYRSSRMVPPSLRRLQDGPQGAQDGLPTAPEAPKTATRRTQDGPRRLQERPMGAPERPKTAQDEVYSSLPTLDLVLGTI